MLIIQKKFIQHKLPSLTILTLSMSCLSLPSYANNSLWDMSLEDLGKIRVTSLASGTATPLDKAAAIATVITADDIEAMGARDIDEVLETVPGLHVGRSDQVYAPKYTIRGITSTNNPQTLMLINGVPLTTLFTGNRGQVWAGMPVKSIARIEVIRGPGSALYGADAYAGVINIITKSSKDLYGTQVGASVGSFNTQSAWVTHGQTYTNTQVAFSLEAQTTDGWDGVINQDRQTQFDGALGTSASLAPNHANTMKDMIDARFELTHKQATLRAGYQGRYNIGTGPGLAQALDPNGRFKSDRFNVDYTHIFDDIAPDWHIEARTSYYYLTQEVTQNALVFPKGAFSGAYPNGFIGNPELKEENARFNLSGLYKGFDHHHIRLGTGFYWGDIFEVTESKNFNPDFSPRATGLTDVSDSAETFLPEKGRTNHYVFVQDEWKLAPNWQLTTGLRYDSFSDFGSTTNPRLALVWATTPTITSKFLYGKAFRAPSVAELFVANNPIQQGNPNLTPETIDTYELAFSHQLSDSALYSANIFYYKISDYISFVPTNGNIQAQNIGQRHGSGFELEGDYSPIDDLRLLANFSYQRAIDDNTDAAVGEAPQQQAYLRAEWQLATGWHLNPQATWVGKQKRVAGDTRKDLDAYTTVDITLRKQRLAQALSMAVSVRNVLDADVREASPVPVYIPNDFPMAGRSVFVEAQYQF